MRRLLRRVWNAARRIANPVFRPVQARWRRFRDRGTIRQYLRGSANARLHIGSGPRHLPGWLNSDLDPPRGAIYLDGTKRFPFSDGLFDIVYSEHMIEHVPYPQGLGMLAECWRVLKPGGRIRIATPDLAFLIQLYREDKSALQTDYLKWAIESWFPSADVSLDTFVINNFVRHWGHQFIYDEKTLRHALERTGFADVRKQRLNQSDTHELRGLENVDRMPPGFLELETLVVEARKPDAVPPASPPPPFDPSVN